MRILWLCVSFSLLACSGYRFQGTENPLKQLGIEKIYVESFKNFTYRSGLEQTFTTALIRELEKSRAFQVVSDRQKADAILVGQINTATVDPSSTKGISVAGKDVQIASEYSASISCTIFLYDRNKRVIFNQSIGASKVHPASVQTGDAGSTAPLTNDSEQRLAYEYLATQMMASVYQRMIDIF
jgi:hypothetical protein